MIGLKKRDIKKALKAGAKAGGMSLALEAVTNRKFTKNMQKKKEKVS